MFKKFLAMIVAIAMLATMFIVPSTVTASDIELPTGSWMTLKATEVESFKAGDTVEITYTISDVDPEIYLLTIDLYFEHSDALVPVIGSFTDTCADVNAATDEDDAWEMLKRVDAGEGVYIGLMEDSDNYLGTNQSDVLSFTLVFTATRDSVPGENLVWSTDVSLMTIDFEEDMGNGVLVKAAGEAATPVPTEEPTPVPTPAPTPVPTAKPFNSEGKLVDIDFTTSDQDKAGSLTYTKTNLDCPWYTGSVRLTNEFTIEYYAKIGAGITMFQTAYAMECAGTFIESWLVGPNKPYVSYNGLDGGLHHIVVSATGTAYSMYVDGVLVSEDTTSEIPRSTNLVPGEIAIGHGSTDKKLFRIYDTGATAADVVALYEAATYVPETTPEPTPAPTEKPAFDVNAPVIDIDYSSNRVVDKKGVLTFGRNAAAAKFVNLKDYGYDVKALDNASIGNSLKYTGGDVDTSEGLVIEIFGVFKTNEQFLGKGYWSAECNADGTVGFWETLVGGEAYICSATSVADGKAHHIVLVSDGAMMKLYIDGQLDATKEWAQKYNTLTGGNWYLNHTGGTPYTVRNRIWNGANMQMPTDEDIAAMYAQYPVYVYVPVEYTGALVLDSKADKLIYDFGEEFDAAGITASKIIVNGEVIDITGDVTVDASAFNPTVAGKYVIKVSYEYNSDIYTNVFTVKVNEAPYVRSIALAAKPVKLIYAAGEELDLTGLAVTAYSTDGTVETITEGIEVTGYDANTVGVQRVTATYAGRTTTFSVKVI